MSKTIAEVVIENSSPTFDKVYSYIVPEELENTAQTGARVRVPFGRGNKPRTGLIIGMQKSNDTQKLKAIKTLIDYPSILSEEGVKILFYLKEHTFCTWFDAFRLLIPSGLGIEPKIVYSLGINEDNEDFTLKQNEIIDYLKKLGKPISDKTFYKNMEITSDNEELLMLISKEVVLKTSQLKQKVMDEKIAMISLLDDDYTGLTPKQTHVLDFIKSEAPVSLKETIYYTGVTRSVVDNLEKRGVIGYYEDIVPRIPYKAKDEKPDAIILSTDQQEVYEKLAANTQKYNTSLLYGITGAGKTQVFLKLIKDVVENGKGAIVMVPEISLTSQTVRVLQNQFGKSVAVLHSGLSLGERNDEWKRIKSGDARVVVGTRSAVFAPVENLGIIVIDEEQEHTYKSERSPRFHTRDIAINRMKYHNGLLLLCSATPSVESYYYAKTGKYNFYSLTNRYGCALLPDVEVVDMTEPSNLSSSLSLSQPLLDELYSNLQNGQQSILLLNRRGYSTVVKCSECGEVAECKNCSVAMTYHSENNSLICHYCGFREPLSSSCSSCGSSFIKYSGIGTQKLESELKELFKDARILRMDMDTTMAKDSHRKMVESFGNQEYDILIGTQMVAKGFNFPNVTLVGIVNADQSLFAEDFRSYERSFSLFTQVVGRSGRADRKGRAVIQTFTPAHPIIELAAEQNYPSFYNDEIISRKLHLYPPFCTITGFGFVGESHNKTREMAESFGKEFKRLAKTEYDNIPLRVLGPAPNEMLKIAEKYRYKLIVKCRNDKNTRQLFDNMLKWFYKNTKDVSIYIDMHYDRM